MFKKSTDHDTGAVNARQSVVLLAALAVMILALLTWKASTASMTHDESSTYLNYVDSDLRLLSCHSNPECWGTGNNHWLNTAMMRISSSVLGPSEIALRLPNLIMLALYLCSVVFLARAFASTWAGSLGAIAIMVLNPYVLDFFALARGYGMGVGLSMLSMAMLWHWLTARRSWYVAIAIALAMAAVFANLTFAPVYVALCLSLIVYTFRVPMTRRRQYAVWFSAAVTCALLVAFFYQPVGILIGLGEFDHGTPSPWLMWQQFVRDSLYGVRYFGALTVAIISIAGAVVMAGAVFVPWRRRTQHDHPMGVSMHRIVCGIFIGTLALLLLNHIVTGAQFPIGRKSVVVFAPAALLTFLSLTAELRTRKSAPLIFLLVMALAGYHFIRTFDRSVYREWWYDASTKQMLMDLTSDASANAPVHLATEWIFHHTAEFYVRTKDMPIRLEPYDKTVEDTKPVEYYYIHPEHLPALMGTFREVRNYDGRLLMKRDDR